MKLLRERQVLSPEAMPNVAPIFRLLRPRTARRPRPGAVAPSLGLQRPHFAAANAGQGGVITPLESAGSAVVRLIGDSSDSSGTYTTPQAALRAPRQVHKPNVGAARGPSANSASFLYPSGFGRRGDDVEVDAIDATPNHHKKKQGTTLRPATPSSSK